LRPVEQIYKLPTEERGDSTGRGGRLGNALGGQFKGVGLGKGLSVETVGKPGSVGKVASTAIKINNVTPNIFSRINYSPPLY